MKMIMTQRHLLLLLSTVGVSVAWTVPQRHVTSLHRPLSQTTQKAQTLLRMSDQWDDEELPAVTSYDDAASSLMKRKEEADLEGQSDEAVPGVSSKCKFNLVTCTELLNN